MFKKTNLLTALALMTGLGAMTGVGGDRGANGPLISAGELRQRRRRDEAQLQEMFALAPMRHGRGWLYTHRKSNQRHAARLRRHRSHQARMKACCR